MMRLHIVLIAIVLFKVGSIDAQEFSHDDRLEILKILDEQVVCWNKGDIGCFMNGYWKSDSLSFISDNEIMHGWQFVYDRYKKNYPDKSAMGKLAFTVLSVKAISNKYAYVIGKWEVVKEKETPGGHFSLIFQRINGKWLIVADHTG